MPKFITYQRPAPVNKANWGNGKGAPKPGRKAAKAMADKPPALPPMLRGEPRPSEFATSMNGCHSLGSTGLWHALPTLQCAESSMHKFSTVPAFIVWAGALLAILTPPQITAAGFDALLYAQEEIFALVEEPPDAAGMPSLPVRGERPDLG